VRCIALLVIIHVEPVTQKKDFSICRTRHLTYYKNEG